MMRTFSGTVARPGALGALATLMALLALGGCDRGSPSPEVPDPTPDIQATEVWQGDSAPMTRPGAELTTLTVALASTMEPGALNRRYGPLLRHISLRCGARSWIEPYGDSEALVQALAEGAAQVALLDTSALALALARQAPIEVFAMGLHGPDVMTRSLLVAPVDGPVRRVQDAAGARLALATTDSLVGAVAPAWMVAQQTGQALDGHFSEVITAGSPIAALRLVAAGGADVAVCDTLTSQILQPGAELTYHDFRTIAQSPPLPGPALVMRSDLATDVKARVREAFQNTPQRIMLPGLDSLENRYRSASLSDYVVALEMIESLAVLDGGDETLSDGALEAEAPDASPPDDGEPAGEGSGEDDAEDGVAPDVTSD